MQAELLQLGGSLIAIAAVVALAHWLGFSKGARLTSTDEAREILRLTAGGFEPVEVVLDAKGEGAIARDTEGRLGLLVKHGGAYIGRVPDPRARFVWDDKVLSVHDRTISAKPIVLRFDNNVPGWVGRLTDAK